MPDKYLCRMCSKTPTATKNNRYRTHTDGDGEPCPNSSEVIPEDLLVQGSEEKGADPGVPSEGKDFTVCPACRRNVKLTANGYYEHHMTTLRGNDRCQKAGTRFRPLKKLDDVPLPGDDLPEKGVYAQQQPGSTTSTAPTSVSAGAGSSPTEPLPTSGPMTEDAAVSLLEKELGAVKVATFLQPAELPEPARTNLERQPMEGSQEPVSSPSSERVPSAETPSSPELPSTPPPSKPFESEVGEVFSLGTRFSARYLQPFSPYLQPVPVPPEKNVYLQPPAYEATKAVKLDGEAKDLATRVKETFYAYSNRKTKDNRSAQTTLGPSEIGTPCDRRLAMELMGVPPVNPGGDGWAAFVGTCTHVGMAEIYSWANADTGRYAVEIPLTFGSVVMPRGTSDLLDRREGQIVDWKVMGAYSLKKFKNEGPSATYRTQGHVYGLGAALQGEKVKSVAVVGLPRAGSSLDEMHVWTEKFDRKLAEAAIARVERIHEQVQEIGAPDGLGQRPSMSAVAQQFEPADDCHYCPFFLKGDKEMEKGCPGK